jgi:hypothetical protein
LLQSNKLSYQSEEVFPEISGTKADQGQPYQGELQDTKHARGFTPYSYFSNNKGVNSKVAITNNLTAIRQSKSLRGGLLHSDALMSRPESKSNALGLNLLKQKANLNKVEKATSDVPSSTSYHTTSSNLPTSPQSVNA